MKNQVTERKDSWTILKLLNWAAAYFNSHAIDNPKSSAEILLAHALELRRIDLYLQHDRPLNQDELAKFKRLIQRRRQREPVAYIVGEKEFWSLPLKVTSDVLIPRPETECLVEKAIEIMNQNMPGGALRILDLGTGSGAIVLALASQQKQHHYFASDISPGAIRVAKQNALTYGSSTIHFFCGDWLLPLGSSAQLFDLIVSNPPYIPRNEIPGLQPEIHGYEPLLALEAGRDGLRCLEKLMQEAWPWLRPGGYLLMEMGYNQKEAVAEFGTACGHYEDISFQKDYSGHDRVVSMRRNSYKQ